MGIYLNSSVKVDDFAAVLGHGGTVLQFEKQTGIGVNAFNQRLKLRLLLDIMTEPDPAAHGITQLPPPLDQQVLRATKHFRKPGRIGQGIPAMFGQNPLFLIMKQTDIPGQFCQEPDRQPIDIQLKIQQLFVGNRQIGQFLGKLFVVNVNADAKQDIFLTAGRSPHGLNQNAADLAPADMHVINPFEAGFGNILTNGFTGGHTRGQRIKSA